MIFNKPQKPKNGKMCKIMKLIWRVCFLKHMYIWWFSETWNLYTKNSVERVKTIKISFFAANKFFTLLLQIKFNASKMDNFEK